MPTNDKLHILWTNDNFITSEKMVFMYGINAKRMGLWDDVTIKVWGATIKLAAENKQIQDLIEEAKLEGIHLTACKACADQLGVTAAIEALDIEVIYQAEPFTKILKDNEKLVTI